ncbi:MULTISPECIES: hypothetical protein [Actinotignum]|uniref:hypothetical protein n=1 Tax=Actinotignum TaxID=1653174 RepID=UPI000B3539FE|nr:hypothetical protein [Actinotignum timonense]MDY5157629.1 hypothetical protein [Actinotignum timonense]
MPRKKKKVVLPELGSDFDLVVIEGLHVADWEAEIPPVLSFRHWNFSEESWREQARAKVEEFYGRRLRYFQTLTGITESAVTALYGRPGVSYRATCIGLAVDMGCELHGDLDEKAVLQKLLDTTAFTAITRAYSAVPGLVLAGGIRVRKDPEVFKVGNPPLEWVLAYGLLSAAYMIGLLITGWPCYRTPEYPDGLMCAVHIAPLGGECDEHGFVPVTERAIELAGFSMRTREDEQYIRVGGLLSWR